jgi:hypothetical protein
VVLTAPPSDDPLRFAYQRPWVYPKQELAIWSEARYACIEASTKSGKAQPLDAAVWTPDGPRPMGTMVLGQRVLTPTGQATLVGIYPQGDRAIYRVSFSNGAATECTDDHLWEVHGLRPGQPAVLTTAQLRAIPARRRRKLWVPVAEPVEMTPRPVPMDPYLLGVLLGDGGLTTDTIRFATTDPEIVDSVAAATEPWYEVRHDDRCNYRVATRVSYQRIPRAERLGAVLRDLDVWGRYAHEKHVPALYRYNSTDVRLAVLQGLLDTDGWVDARGQPEFSTSSPTLATHVVELVESLGGLARIREQPTPGRLAHRVRVTHPDAPSLFRLARKRARARPKVKHMRRTIRAITLVATRPAQCIQLDDPRGLYLTDRFIATHNTVGCLLWFAEQAMQGGPGRNYWWVAPIFAQSKIAYRRLKFGLPADLYHANDGEMTLTLPNGAVLWFKSGEKPDSLYGEDVYAAVIDEASRVREESWHAVRSTLTATQGPIRIIGNVKGRKNWAFRLARRAEAGEQNMSYQKITAHDAAAAGVLDPEEVADAERLLPPDVYKELYLAEASEDQGNPFGYAAIAACVGPLSSALPVVWGWDVARSHDFTVGIALDAEGAVCHFERFQMPWPETIDTIERVTQDVPAWVDATGIGDAPTQELQRRRSNFNAFLFTGSSKQALMEGLAIAIQSRRVRYPAGQIKTELDDFEYVYTRTGVRYCVDPDTRVLTDGLLWVPAGTLRPGDGLLAFDEYPEPGQKTRCWRRSVVTEAAEITRPSSRIVLADGAELTASNEHRWLVDICGHPDWRRTDQLRAPHPTSTARKLAPSRLHRLLDTWTEPTSYDAGYLAAAFDGEGSIQQTDKGNGGHNARLTFAQRENAMAVQVREKLARLGFTWAEARSNSHDVLSLGLTGRRHEFLRFLGQVRPQRLLDKFDVERLGTLEAKALVPVAAIEPLGERSVIALGTTSKTLITEGIASHNSAPEGAFDDAVCALALANLHRQQALEGGWRLL